MPQPAAGNHVELETIQSTTTDHTSIEEHSGSYVILGLTPYANNFVYSCS